MAPGVGVRDGLCCALVGAGLVRSKADRGEGSGEVIEVSCKRRARVADEDGVKVHPPPVLFEGRDEGGVFLGILRVFLVAFEVSGDAHHIGDK